MNEFRVVRDFEAELCRYTGAKYAVTTNSCTMAILLACAWRLHYVRGEYLIAQVPCRTYVGVPMSVIHAGNRVRFVDDVWSGEYKLNPLPVWDSARRFRADMFRPGQMQCLSFHVSKILGASQGGAILHDDADADAWLRRARFDGRGEGVPAAEDVFQFPAWHCYMSPDTAAQLLWKLRSVDFRRNNPDLPNPDYPDLSKQPAFADYVVQGNPFLIGDPATALEYRQRLESMDSDERRKLMYGEFTEDV
jgi:hypothetical protein